MTGFGADFKRMLSRPGPWMFTFYGFGERSEEHTSELQSRLHLVCRLLLEKKKKDRELSNFLWFPLIIFFILILFSTFLCDLLHLFALSGCRQSVSHTNRASARFSPELATH